MVIALRASALVLWCCASRDATIFGVTQGLAVWMNCLCDNREVRRGPIAQVRFAQMGNALREKKSTLPKKN